MQLDFQQFRTKMEKMTLRRFGRYFNSNILMVNSNSNHQGLFPTTLMWRPTLGHITCQRVILRPGSATTEYVYSQNSITI